jgi:hypothetical protein
MIRLPRAVKFAGSNPAGLTGINALVDAHGIIKIWFVRPEPHSG